MPTTIRTADTSDDAERVFRFRYELYCEQQRLFLDVADHDAKMLRDADDDTAVIWLAERSGRVVGTLRANLGRMAPFSPELVATFDLDRFEAVVGCSRLGVLSRFMVAPDRRGGTVSAALMATAARYGIDNRIDVAFCDCEPHLIALYQRLGFRGYKRLFNHPTSGLLVPLVLVLSDRDHLVRTSSLLLQLLPDTFPRTCEPALLDLIQPAHVAQTAESGAFAGLEAGPPRLHEPELTGGLTAGERERLETRSAVLTVSAGDFVIRAGHVSRTVYVVLDGTFEVLSDERLLAVATPGDTFGEIALLLDEARTADVRAASDGRLVALSDRVLERLIRDDPAMASKLLLNLSRILARKLVSPTLSRG